ncbi:MAG: DEAD/DEAH box helicase family protein [Candidatus Atribacteria bacterium]|nr:DEAD/DEAH box helicase family protein [Candidatus Atribacteria bacterium]
MITDNGNDKTHKDGAIKLRCLKDIKLKSDYNTEDDNIIRDFYAPCLKNSVTYDRAVGYFRANIYRELGEDLLNFVIRGGKVRLVCSPDMPEKDEDAAREGYRLRGKRSCEEQEVTLVHIIEAMSRDPQEVDCLNMLRLLIEKGSLDLYLALRYNGIYHRKIGSFCDMYGNSVVFGGSGNETQRAISSIQFWGNDEEFDVYRSWGNEFEASKAMRKLEYLERLFAGGTKTTKVRLLNEIELEALNKFRLCSNFEDCRKGAKLRAAAVDIDHTDKIQPRYFQEEAIKAWKSAGSIGILSMATGTGKTFTALFAIQDLLNEGRVILILVPSKILLSQWYEEIRKIYPNVPILLAGGGNNWRANNLKRVFTSNNSLLPRIILATMSSANSCDFLEFLSQADDPVLVADEVHSLGSPNNRKILNRIQFKERLGLSATPERLFDPEGNEALGNAFGVQPVFQLPLGGKVRLSGEDQVEVPIIGKYLCNYYYYFESVHLTDQEQSQWDDLTRIISQTIAKNKNNNVKIDERIYNKLQILLIKRSRIIKRAREKINCAGHVILNRYPNDGRWIVYCEDERQMNEVADAIRKKNRHLQVLTYHSKMGQKERESTLEFLESHPCIVVSIRCLDEGVDIPVVDGALILASSMNPRQYIQRRGRVLRKAIGKRNAIIIDCIVLPKLNYKGERDPMPIVRGELARAWEFANHAINKDITHELWKLCQEYDVDIDLDAKLNYIN